MELTDYDNRVIALMDVLSIKGGADITESRQLFDIYNERFSPMENGIHCCGCRARVYDRVNEYYLSLKNKN